MDSTQIQQAYSAYISKHNERPKNMAFFAESMKIDESRTTGKIVDLTPSWNRLDDEMKT